MKSIEEYKNLIGSFVYYYDEDFYRAKVIGVNVSYSEEKGKIVCHISLDVDLYGMFSGERVSGDSIDSSSENLFMTKDEMMNRFGKDYEKLVDKKKRIDARININRAIDSVIYFFRSIKYSSPAIHGNNDEGDVNTMQSTAECFSEFRRFISEKCNSHELTPKFVSVILSEFLKSL